MGVKDAEGILRKEHKHWVKQIQLLSHCYYM